jgi:hypothetical protein
MNSALQLLSEFEAITADGFPLGQEGADVLDQLERIGKLLEDAKSFYKAQLAKNRNCVPGWSLKPGAMRRGLDDPAKVWGRLSDVLSTEEFMQAVTLKVGVLQDIWSRAAGIPGTHARAAFDCLLANLIVSLPTAPSLVRSKPREL